MDTEVKQALQTLTVLADSVALNKAQRDVIYGALGTIRVALGESDKKPDVK